MTDNEKIAKFMDGFRLQIPRNMWHIKSRNQTLDSEDIKYDTSWDWLHPVINKIKNIKAGDHTSITSINWRRQIIDMSISSDIESVYRKVVQFIDHFNYQKQ